MYQQGKLISILIFLFMFSPLAISQDTSAIDPDSLVKVTPENDPACVEYFTYKDELYCSTTAQSSKPVDPEVKKYEKLNIVFDDRPWKMAWGKQDSSISTVEYVPSGEEVEHWNELITSQFFPGLQEKITPKEYAEGFIKDLKDSGYEPITSILEDTEDQVIFEFRIEKPKNQIQDELQMITSDNKGLYVLHYVIKKSDMGEENRTKWIDNLKNSSIKE